MHPRSSSHLQASTFLAVCMPSSCFCNAILIFCTVFRLFDIELNGRIWLPNSQPASSKALFLSIPTRDSFVYSFIYGLHAKQNSAADEIMGFEEEEENKPKPSEGLRSATIWVNSFFSRLTLQMNESLTLQEEDAHTRHKISCTMIIQGNGNVIYHTCHGDRVIIFWMWWRH